MFEVINEHEDPRESLVEFLFQVKSFLIRIAFERYFESIQWRSWRQVYVPQGLLENYRLAISEYRESGQFELLIEAVRGLDEGALSRGGLSGAQLFLKRETVRVKERRFLRWPRLGIFRRMVQAIDVPLGSILDAAGVGSALEELKEIAGLLPEHRREGRPF